MLTELSSTLGPAGFEGSRLQLWEVLWVRLQAGQQQKLAQLRAPAGWCAPAKTVSNMQAKQA
jgi:hypothetical protein